MGLDGLGVASYLLTHYFSCAVLTDDALAVLENVEVGYYHDYHSARIKGSYKVREFSFDPKSVHALG